MILLAGHPRSKSRSKRAGAPGPNQRRCWRVQAEAHYQAHRDDPGYQDPSTYDQPWWDGEPMASDRQRSPELIAELEAEPELGAG